ncbi:MAG: cation transporter [Bacteroidota bacterium]|nr:cation transporter [Bacteroidota bacterium]
MSASGENIRLQKVITGVAILLVIIKLVAWMITGSLAILTDALEGFVNILSGLIGLFSLTFSQRPKDRGHPYGHGKIEFISAAFEGFLVMVAGMVIIYEAIQSFVNPHEIAKVDMGIYLVSLTGLINYFVGRICVKTGKKNGSLPLISGGKHLISDSYTTVGIILGLVLIYFTGAFYWDGVVSIIFAGIIILTGYRVLRSSVAGIMDEADVQLLDSVVSLLEENRRENWIDLHNLRIIKYGSKLHCDCHVTLPWYLNLNEAHDEIDDLSELIRGNFRESVELFVHADGCQEFSCRICTKQDCKVRKHEFERKIHWTVQNVSQNAKHSL